MIRFLSKNHSFKWFPATRLDRVLEMATAFFLTIMWALGLTVYKTLSQNPLLIAGDWDAESLLWILFIATLLCALLALLAYTPSIIHFPVTIKKECVAAQYRLMSRMMRSINVVMSLLFLTIVCQLSASCMGWNENIFVVMSIAFILILLFSIIVYTFKVWQIGKRFDYFK